MEALMQHKEERKSQVKIVTSLLTEMMNFGSLSRSCEIFNVTSVIVPDIKVVESEEFKSLSMSSEKWVQFEEVTS